MKSSGSYALTGSFAGAAVGGVGGLVFMNTVVPLQTFTSAPLWLLLALPVFCLYIGLPARVTGALGALLGARVKSRRLAQEPRPGVGTTSKGTGL